MQLGLLEKMWCMSGLRVTVEIVPVHLHDAFPLPMLILMVKQTTRILIDDDGDDGHDGHDGDDGDDGDDDG